MNEYERSIDGRLVVTRDRQEIHSNNNYYYNDDDSNNTNNNINNNSGTGTKS